MKPGRDLSYKGVQLRDLDRKYLYKIIADLREAVSETFIALDSTLDVDVRALYPADVERAFYVYDHPEVCCAAAERTLSKIVASAPPAEVAGRPIHYYSTQAGETHCLVQTDDGYVTAGRLLSSTRDSAVVAPL